MNRNTFLGTLGVGVLLTLMCIVHQQEANSIDSNRSSTLSSRDAANQTITQNLTHMSQLANSSNRFGFNLFAQINSQSPDKNIIISPSSIAIALAMAGNGTEGKTKEELIEALELNELDSAAIDNSYQKLMETLKTADPGVKIAIANSLWANQKVTLKEQFVNNAKGFYQAQVSSLNFADFQTKNKINNWVAQNTANKIPEIVDSVSPQDVLYLINAIYFKGIWTNKFDLNTTTDRPFYRDSNSSSPHPMMNQTGKYRYHENDNFQAVRLPYGEQEELGMYIFLPGEDSSLTEFNQLLNGTNWQEWISQMRSRSGKIAIPRFKLEYETDLIQFLSKLGIERVFAPNLADFSAMTDIPVAINKVKHKTFIEVNEEGTEAAAVTSIGIRITSAIREDPPFKMNVNRPFFFAIRDDITETILFMGNVVEP